MLPLSFAADRAGIFLRFEAGIGAELVGGIPQALFKRTRGGVFFGRGDPLHGQSAPQVWSNTGLVSKVVLAICTALPLFSCWAIWRFGGFGVRVEQASDVSRYCPTISGEEQKSYARSMKANAQGFGLLQLATLTAKRQRSEARLLRHAVKARTR